MMDISVVNLGKMFASLTLAGDSINTDTITKELEMLPTEVKIEGARSLWV